MDGHAGQFVSVKAEVAAVHRDQSDHHVKAGGFARPVRPQQADHFTTADAQGDILDDGAGYVAFFRLFT